MNELSSTLLKVWSKHCDHILLIASVFLEKLMLSLVLTDKAESSSTCHVFFAPSAQPFCYNLLLKRFYIFSRMLQKFGRKHQKHALDLEALNKYENNAESRHHYLNVPSLKVLLLTTYLRARYTDGTNFTSTIYSAVQTSCSNDILQ